MADDLPDSDRASRRGGAIAATATLSPPRLGANRPGSATVELCRLGIALLAVACAPPPSATPAPATPRPTDVESLRTLEEPSPIAAVAGHSVSGSFAADGVVTLELSPASSHDAVVELEVQSTDSDLEIVVVDASGRARVRADQVDGPAGPERAAVVGATPEGYRVEVRRVDRGDGGRFVLSVRAVRPPTPRDRARSEADSAFADAEALRERRDRISGQRAAERYHEALDGFRTLGDTRRQAEILHRLGWLHRKTLENPRAAIEFYASAEQRYAELGETRRRSVVLNNLGRVWFKLGEMELAEAHWHHALEIKRSLGDHSGAAAASSNLGLVCRYTGRFQQALVHYDAALDALRPGGASIELGRAFNNRGRFYASLGQSRQALADLHRALGIGRELDAVELQAMALTAIGAIELDQEQPETALSRLEAARDLRLEAPSLRGQAVTARGLGEVLERLGRLDEAHDAHERARALFAEQGSPRDLAHAHHSLGRLALRAGDPEAARDHGLRAESIFRELGDTEGLVSARSLTARALRLGGDLAAALATMTAAFDDIDRLRLRAATPDLRAAFLARYQDDISFLVDGWMERHRAEPGRGHDVVAFEIHERSRARALADRIVGSAPRRRGSSASRADEGRAVERLEALARQARVLRATAASPTQLAVIEDHLDEAVRRLRSIRGGLALEAKRPETSPSAVLDVEAIRRRLLDEHSVLLAYRLGDARSFAWIVTGERFESVELAGAEEIAGLVKKAHDLQRSNPRREARAQTRHTLRRLSRVVLAPVVDRLDARRLLIVADGVLHFVPFSALPWPAASLSPADDSEPLIARHEVVLLPSASSVASLRQRAEGRSWPRTVAVFAETTDDGSTVSPDRAELPFAADEKTAIRDLARALRGVDGTSMGPLPRSALDPEIAAYRILHFATHSEIDAARPELSRLLLGGDDTTDGVLYADEVASLHLPAQLVVLSACRTALGQAVRGEGFVGLPQSFFEAGASAVLVSLWPVDDRATAELMRLFYAAYLGGQLDAPAALRHAQETLRHEPGWSAPYYWAGFVFLGDWRTTPRSSATG